MNHRGKSSPVQSNIRTVTTPNRGQTPPPPSQIRGHFEDPSHFQQHYQAAGAAYQPSQPQYVEMSKAAGGRVPGPGLAQTPQGYNVSRAQQSYNPMGEAPEQQPNPAMWPQQQSSFYFPAPSPNIRQSRMPMNNSGMYHMQGMTSNVPNAMYISGMPAHSGYSNPAAMQPFMQSGNSQFVQYPQPRMSYPTLPPQQQIGYMHPQFGTTGGTYPASPYYPPMQMTNTSRPSSAGPQGAVGGGGGGGPKPPRSKKLLVITDPNTGEDVSDKVLKLHGEETDPSVLQSQAHREAVHLEFATKIAILAKDKHPQTEGSHAIQIKAPPPAAEAPSHHPPVMEEPEGAAVNVVEPQHMPPMQQPTPQMPVMNGEPETDIPEQVVSAEPQPLFSIPEFHPAQQETVAAAPDVQTPSSALPAAPVVEVVEAAAPVNVVPDKEMSPSPVVEMPVPAVPVKEPSPPAESAEVVPPSPVPPMTSTVVSAADAAKVIAETASPSPPPVDKPPQASAPQQPQPQRQDGKRGKKNKKDLNKKSKEGSDMDAFYDPQSQSSQDSKSVATPEQPKEVSPPPPEPTPSSPPAAAASAPSPPPPTPAAAPSPTPTPTPAPETVAEAVKAEPKNIKAEPKPLKVETKSIKSEPKSTKSEPKAAKSEPKPVESPPSPKAASPVPEPAAAPTPPAEEPVRHLPPPAPTVKVDEPKEPAEPAQADSPDENGVEPEAEPAEARPKLPNGIELNYKEGQWSPFNPEGKKQYDREFLLKLQANPESRKAPNLPDMPDIIVDPRSLKQEDFQKAQLAASRSVPDFTPGFFKSYQRPGQSLTKRNSQQRGRGGPGSQSAEPQRVIITRQEVHLHKSENAYKPLFQSEENIDEQLKETRTIMRDFTSILNKLTPEKFDRLSAKALELKINTEERLTGVTDLIFEKAISEQKFATQYADLCAQLLKLPKLVMKDKADLTFRAVLLTKCQKEFEKDKKLERDLEERQEKSDTLDDEKKAQLAQEAKQIRHRSMGNIRFIGELFRLKMLTENIMHDCIFKLLKLRDDDSIECLTKLLDTIGGELDIPKAKTRMDQYFQQLEKMTSDLTAAQQSATGHMPKSKDPKDKLSTRVKFGVLDIIELRRNRWVKRRIHAQNMPTTLTEIHQKAKQEQQEAQFLNSQPRSEPQGPRNSRGGGGGGGGGGKGRPGQGDDGWNTVPARPVKQQIDVTRMKITKTNVDETTLTLGGGNKFQNWGRGSQGGGSRSQEQEKLGNRYNALNNLSDNDSRRGFGRSPARSDSRGGAAGAGRMGGDRDRRDRDRDYRKPASRGSMEERERAVQNTRSLLGAGGPSNPSSRNASRDNSRSRDMPPPAAPSQASGIDVSQMNAGEIDRRINTIAEEFHSNQKFEDTLESVAELSGLDKTLLVTTLFEKLVEKVGKTRQLLGELLFRMVKDKYLSVDNLSKGIGEFLQFAEDLELDIPKIWDNMAEVFASLVTNHQVLPLSFLPTALQPLVAQGNKKEALFLPKILKLAADYKSKDVIQAQWVASGLKLSDFGVSEGHPDLQWLKGPQRNTVYEGVRSRLRNNATNEEIIRWLDGNFNKQDKEANRFVRELVTAVCESSVDASKKLMKAAMMNRLPLLQKYIVSQENGTQALFAIQHWLCELKHPQNLGRDLFEMLDEEDVISEDSFFDWEGRDGPREDMSGKGAVQLNLKNFFDSLRSAREEDRTS